MKYTISSFCDDVKVQNKKKEEMEMVNKNGVVVDFKTGVEKSSEGDLTGIENNMNSVCSGMFNDVGKPGTKQLVIVNGLLDVSFFVDEQGESELFGSTYGVLSCFEGLKSGGMENMDYNLLTS
ncbi:hypothetical protein DKX38_007994 [Salix brachista]|uniref:Uncharacterized protein n=1 Tax=Salix brachista TaxID=2182728 RepID=A0A5N5MPK2_9ROSI|nr:hypothetical protein DKX38_007994 [Salix brachista]